METKKPWRCFSEPCDTQNLPPLLTDGCISQQFHPSPSIFPSLLTMLWWWPLTCFKKIQRAMVNLHNSGCFFVRDSVCMCVYLQKFHVAAERDDLIHNALALPPWFSPIRISLIQDAHWSIKPQWWETLSWTRIPDLFGWINKYFCINSRTPMHSDNLTG